jgi:hypothetical protein
MVASSTPTRWPRRLWLSSARNGDGWRPTAPSASPARSSRHAWSAPAPASSARPDWSEKSARESSPTSGSARLVGPLRARRTNAASRVNERPAPWLGLARATTRPALGYTFGPVPSSPRHRHAAWTFCRQWRPTMSNERTVFFDPTTLAMLRSVVDDAWSRLPAGQTEITRSLLAQRILRAAKAGERDPARLRARAISTSAHAGR